MKGPGVILKEILNPLGRDGLDDNLIMVTSNFVLI